MTHATYAIITPAYNEERFLPRVIQSVCRQRLRPKRWIIVDDRSTDKSPEIIRHAASQNEFISAVAVSGDHERRLGPNVVHLFQQGCDRLNEPVDFIVKMDADVLLPDHYFEDIARCFRGNDRLGMVSGKTYIRNNGKWILERMPDGHVSGACKSYRWTCFEEIKGLIPILGWDILDGAKARLFGWQTRSYTELPLFHLRPVGTAKGAIRGQIGHGRCMYAIRAFAPFVAAKALYRCFEPPFLAGLFIIFGYVMASLHREERLGDRTLARFVRREQMARLLGKTLGQEAIMIRSLKGSASPKDAMSLQKGSCCFPTGT